jgi:outer membrane protein assembly complex protein YaeT
MLLACASNPLPQKGRRLVLGLCIGLVFLGSKRRVALAQGESAPWGQRVVDIRLDSDAHIKIEAFKDRISQEIGEPLDRSKVTQSLKDIYSTGRFRNLRADVEGRENGVVLVFVGEATFFLGTVRLDGAPKPVSSRALEGAAGLRLGDPISPDNLAAAAQRIKDTLAENAYYVAQVQYTLSRDLDNQVAGVGFSVEAGRPARLSQVEFEGNVPRDRLAAIARWRPGTQLTTFILERGRSRIRNFYVKQGHLQANTTVVSRNYDPEHFTERLTVRVNAGPIVRVRVRGADISSRTLKQLLPVYYEGQTDDLALDSGQRQLEDYLEKKGYFHASVKWQRESRPDPPTISVTYITDRGAQGTFVGFALKGNRAIPTEQLLPVLSLQAKEFPRARGVFSKNLLDHDVRALTALYESKGFLNARVTPQLDDDYENQPNILFVVFSIEEGPLTRVGRLDIRGVEPEVQIHLESLLKAKPGQPYSPTRVDADRDSILGYFADQGYSQAKVTWSASPPSPSHEVDLQYQIEPGLQQKIQGLILIGNEHTRAGLVHRQLTVAPGQWLSQGQLLESQRRLYDLGLFSQVQIAPQDAENPEPEETVLVSMEEAKRWTLGYGFGFDVQALSNAQPQGQYKASPRGSIDLTRLNVGGRNQTFTARGRISDVEKGGAVSYFIPNVGGSAHLDLRLSAQAGQYRDVLTYTSKREEAAVTLQRRYSASTSLQAQYTFRNVEASDLLISPEAIPLYSQPVHVATFGLTYFNDHRDNPIDATKGSFSSADGAVAWQGLGSEANFVRLGGQNSTFYRLNPHVVFARNTRLGIEVLFGPPVPTTITGPDGKPKEVSVRDVPLPERFFMGGPESHRGFSFNQAGPRDPNTGYPIGGRALFLNSVELRFATRKNKYGFVLFDDAGNVFSTAGRMHLLKFSQNSPTDLDYMVNATGVGLRYNTPVGPVRLDVGYTVNPPFYRLVQSEPVSTVSERQLPRWVFSFGIGQSF